VQRDCERWSREIAAELPQLEIHVRFQGKSRSDASVELDAELGAGRRGRRRSRRVLRLRPGERSLEHELERECAPRCDDEQMDRVRRRSLIADVSLGGFARQCRGSLLF
jgi:hypothetical protein